MKTLSAMASLVLVLYGNSLFLLSFPLGFSRPDGSYFGWFMVIEGTAFVIAGIIVGTMGLMRTTGQ